MTNTTHHHRPRPPPPARSRRTNSTRCVNPDRVTLVDFSATWCGPCRRLEPILGELAGEMPEVDFLKLDVDRGQEIAMRYGVQAVPTMLVLRAGRVIDRFVGLRSKSELGERLRQHSATSCEEDDCSMVRSPPPFGGGGMAAERETLDIDVLFVGAGPASLAGAYRLATWSPSTTPNGHGDSSLEVSIAVIEKGAEMGEPRALRRRGRSARAARALSRRWRGVRSRARSRTRSSSASPRSGAICAARFRRCSTTTASTSPRSASWSSGWRRRSRRRASTSSPGFPGRSVLSTTSASSACAPATRASTRTASRRRTSSPASTSAPRSTVLGEGPRGTLAKQLEQTPRAHARDEPAGLRHRAQGDLGDARRARRAGPRDPHDGLPARHHTFGGGFVYGMADDLVSSAWSSGSTTATRRSTRTRSSSSSRRTRDRALLEGGKMRYYGAKAIPEGG